MLYGQRHATAYDARGLYLNDLYVSEHVRLRGIGSALIGSVKVQAPYKRGQYVWWVSDPNNVKARHFYAAMSPQKETTVRARAIVLDG